MKETLREGWEFLFTPSELLGACKERRDSHAAHETYWDMKYGTWNQEMTDGATVDEVPITGGVQRVLRYDPGLQSKVNEAKARRDGHSHARVRFERWVLALEKKVTDGMELRLRFGDVTFFFEPIEELPE